MCNSQTAEFRASIVQLLSKSFPETTITSRNKFILQGTVRINKQTDFIVHTF